MNHFVNICPCEINSVLAQISRNYKAVPTNHAAHIEAACMVIVENFRDEYDDDDVNFVLDHLMVSPDGTKLLMFRMGWDTYTDMPCLSYSVEYMTNVVTDWVVTLETVIDLSDVDSVVEHYANGWYFFRNNGYGSLYVVLHKNIKVVTDNIISYCNAVDSFGGKIWIYEHRLATK